MRKLKRFIAACFAMNGILANYDLVLNLGEGKGTDATTSEIILRSFSLADELIKQENL